MANKLILLFISFFILLFYATPVISADNSEAKIKICHYDNPNDREGRVIVISLSSLKDHYNHGDPNEFYLLSANTCIRKSDMQKKTD